MRNVIKKLIIYSILFSIILFTNNSVLANSEEIINNIEYSDQYKNYLNLSEEEKQKIIIPNLYNIPKTKYEIKNPFYMLRASSIKEERFSLKSIIPNNLKIKSQGDTGECWAFTTLSGLETNLALLNGDTKVYDFSERHMDYYTSKTFKNNVINPLGFNREIGSGNFYISLAYLTNGSGAILEEDMPFEDNASKIDLKEVQNKKVASQVYDYKRFPTYTVDEGNTTEVKNTMKEYIKKYGSIMTQIHGTDIKQSSEYYNNATAALYCDNNELCPINHAVSIVGWDDNFAVSNFKEGHKPNKKGAWIIRNSWGEKIEYDIQEYKKKVFNQYKQQFEANGVTDPSMISDDEIEQSFIDQGFTIVDGKAVYNIGENGFMYVSYEDVNIYTQMTVIEKSADKIDYDKIYQHNFYGDFGYVPLSQSKTYLGEKFEKDNSNKEYLNQVSLNVLETCKCKVYVNPNNDSIKKEDLQLVQLEAGESEIFDAGYHTLEFAEPVKLIGKRFAVVIEIQGTRNNELMIPIESKEENIFKNVTLEEGKSFIASEENFEKNLWVDLNKLTQINSALINGDGTIKAFTTKTPKDDYIQSIRITTPPSKVDYVEGDKFDTTGMVVTATYFSEKEETITNYSINNGDKLANGQETVTISYQGQTVKQSITVAKAKKEEEVEDKKEDNIKENDDENNNEEENKKDNNIEYEEELKIDIKHSNLNQGKLKIISQKNYSFTSGINDYTLIELILTEIEKPTNNESLEYYYYISSNPNEKNIQDWIRIKEKQTAQDNLRFTINSNNIPNYEKISRANKIYIYIRELATVGGNSNALISKAILLENSDSTIIESYVNNKKMSKNTDYDTESNKDNGEKKKKTTEKVSTVDTKQNTPKMLPYTGVKKIILVIICLTSACGIFMYVKYKKISKYVK